MTTGEIILSILLVLISLLLGTTMPWLIKMYGRIVGLESKQLFQTERVETIANCVHKIREKIDHIEIHISKQEKD